MIVAAAVVVVGLASATSSAAGSHRQARLAPSVRLKEPAGLAIAPNGDLIIADQGLNQVIVRLPSGHLQVLAGTGQKDFGGDGGVATNAALNQPDAVALAANGTVYVADVGNNRVRALLPTGRIETVAGDGRSGSSLPTVGAMARNVAMSPSDVAIGPNGRVYVSSGNYVAELSASGVVVSVINLSSTPGVTLRYQQCDPEALALDRTGNLYVGCANSRELIERLTNGKYQLIEATYRPHDFPGIAITYGGALIIANGETILGVISNQSTVMLGLKSFPHVVFVPSGIAIAANGTIYTDCQAGDGFDSGAGLAKITPSGAPLLLRLWKGP
jgi:hypothetical protein